MRRRGQSPSAFDLFAFQDVITSTTGILLMVTLLLALSIAGSRVEQMLEEKRQRSQQQEAESRLLTNLTSERKSRLTLQAQVETKTEELRHYLQGEVAQLKQQAEEPAPSDNKVALDLPSEGSMSSPLVVIVEGYTFFLLGDRRQILYDVTTDSLRAEMKTRNATGILFLVKPSAFDRYDQVLDLGVARTGRVLFPFSIDLIPESWEVSNAQ